MTSGTVRGHRDHPLLAVADDVEGFLRAMEENTRAFFADELTEEAFAERHRAIWDEVLTSGAEMEVLAALEMPPSSRRQRRQSVRPPF